MGFQGDEPIGRDPNTREDVFDVVVIGGGIVGCAMARRFTLEGARVALLEKATDILDGASKANSAILHTGFDAPEGSLELACVRAGYDEYLSIRGELGLVHERSGALVVAWSAAEVDKLEAIRAQAHANGVGDVDLISTDVLRAREPNLSHKALAALEVPGEGIIDPWSAPYAYLEQAIASGAQVFTSCEVTGGTFDGETWSLETGLGPIRATTVINCAGLFGDRLDASLLGEAHFAITPRKGQFVVFDKAARDLVSSIILPVPTERTKGVVLFRTVFGNLAVGPTAEDQESRSDASTDEAALRGLIGDAVAKIPSLEAMPVTAVYAGLRPASEEKEYRIQPHPEKNWITVGGIRSTGLSGALGIARHVFGLYEGMGKQHAPLENPASVTARALAESRPRDWQAPDHGEIVCQCEMVTRREIEAALSGPLAARSLAGLKRQTRATMGRCQGFFCTARLAELTADKFEPPMSQEIGDE
ncbi:MAG TPA: FAD/NAD(P)-binding oxidoreductase [Rhodobacterales bacterium]|nr:FAD/NAD(P)-binding oxidoreductase [Rhodobacterales bacterium]